MLFLDDMTRYKMLSMCKNTVSQCAQTRTLPCQQATWLSRRKLCGAPWPPCCGALRGKHQTCNRLLPGACCDEERWAGEGNHRQPGGVGSAALWVTKGLLSSAGFTWKCVTWAVWKRVHGLAASPQSQGGADVALR